MPRLSSSPSSHLSTLGLALLVAACGSDSGSDAITATSPQNPTSPQGPTGVDGVAPPGATIPSPTGDGMVPGAGGAPIDPATVTPGATPATTPGVTTPTTPVVPDPLGQGGNGAVPDPMGQAGGGAIVPPTCDGGLVACGQSCVDLMTTTDNCGACGSVCFGGRSCVAGGCQCLLGTCDDPPAFPGADGSAAMATGGRGGAVYHVTLLDTDFSDVRVGTLRYGLTQLTGPRTIVFDVSGVISLDRAPVSGYDPNGNGWDTQSRLSIPNDVTVAGQTAPGPIIIMGGLVKPDGTNIILRNVTFAPGYGNRSFNDPDVDPAVGDFPDSFVYDALDIGGTNVMIDHVTTVYATDETVSLNEIGNDITVQYSNISQGQNYPQADAEATGITYTGHALGSLLQGGSNARISFHHNLYAHQKGRLPRVGTEADALTVAGVGAYNDFRNNVFYNWLGTAGTGASGQASQNNFINNFYLAGPGGTDPVGGASTGVQTAAGGTSIFNGSDATNTKVFHSGNLKDINKDGDAADTLALINGDFGTSSFQGAAYTQVPYTGVTDTADVAFTRVLDFVGAMWWNRAPIDARIINEVRTGTGQIVAWADDPFTAGDGAEWQSLINTPTVARPAGFDTDQDGMPDEWELMNQLDPTTADNNGDFDSDGYTNLEEYINELAAWPAPTQTLFVGETNQRYAQITNWRLTPSAAQGSVSATAHWQPSRFDVAQVLSGTAVVDAVDQHAGRLQVGSPLSSGIATRNASTRSAARLEVSAGYLSIADSLDVGAYAEDSRYPAQVDAANGEVLQSGGVLLVERAVVLGGARGSHAVYHLSGGALRAGSLERGPGGGDFDFSGGSLSVDQVGFDLVNRGGTIDPGESSELTLCSRGAPGVGVMRVAGDLSLHTGSLSIDITSNSHDSLQVEGRVQLGGRLELRVDDSTVQPGTSWVILTAGAGIEGQFESVPEGYSVHVIGNRVVLTFGEPLDAPMSKNPVDAPLECRAG